jgi:uncharacterized repeat protein (TIGR03847 family)
MNYVFNAPDKVMVGTRGEVGNRLFLLQFRQERRLLILKLEKMQVTQMALWLGQVIASLGRPGHLPDDFTLEPEYEIDFAVGDIALAIDEEAGVIDATFTDMNDEHEAVVTLTKEWAGGLAIAMTRLIDAGRPPCPLCAGPLDPRGHDCPRTNGHRPPIR